MRYIVFVRHGERSRVGADDPLTERGIAMAHETGRWLRERGIAPAVIVPTRSLRARQTAEALRGALGGVAPLEPERSLPESPATWEALATRLETRCLGPTDAIVVGHHPTQVLIERTFGGRTFNVPRENRAAAFVLERDAGGGWRCVEVWEGGRPGTPPPTE